MYHTYEGVRKAVLKINAETVTVATDVIISKWIKLNFKNKVTNKLRKAAWLWGTELSWSCL